MSPVTRHAAAAGTQSARRGRGFSGGVSQVLHALVLSVAPAALVLRANAGHYLIPRTDLVQVLGVSLAIVIAMIALARIGSPDLGTASLRVSFAWLLLTVGYPALDEAALVTLGAHGISPNAWAAATSAVGVAGAWWLGGRAGRSLRRRDILSVMNIASMCFVAVNVAWFGVANHVAPDVPNTAPALRLHADGAPRTIVFIVPDGLGRLDVLRDYYGVDTTPHERALRDRGFVIAPASRSNYSQTYLSLASTLNLTYLDGIVEARRGTSDWRPLHAYIKQNAVIGALKRLGYGIGWVGSSYSATRENELADECACGRDVGELGLAILKGSPFAHAALEPLTYERHRAGVIHSLDAIATVAGHAPRRFVFAHLLVPHPPFVFGPHARLPKTRFAYFDGDSFEGGRDAYRVGYREQAAWFLERIVGVADAVIRRDPDAVIIIQSDHGPGMLMRHDSPALTDAHERLANFAAVRLPRARSAVPDDVSPVNLFRIVFNEYFDANLPVLPNRSFLSPYRQPYELHPVEEARLLPGASPTSAPIPPDVRE
jgi:hypothetical protein